MRRWILGFALLVLALSGHPQASGTVTVTTTRFGGGGARFTQYVVAITTTAGGAASGNAFSIDAGRLVSIRFHPGTTTPSDLYDVTLVETSGVADLLAGGGADRSNAADQIVQWDPPLFEDGSRTVDVVVANGGNAKTITVTILVQI